MKERFEVMKKQAELEIFQLLRGLVFESLRHAIKDPTPGGKVRLHYAHATAAELCALAIRKRNVIDEFYGNPRHAVFVVGEVPTAGERLHCQIAIATHNFERALYDLFGFVIRNRSVGRLGRAPRRGDQHKEH